MLGIVAAAVALVVVLIVISSGGPDACKGGPDMTDMANVTWTSTDNLHWTGTVSCYDGGSKTIHRTGKDPFG